MADKEKLSKLKSLKFNEPDFENARKNIDEFKKKIKKYREQLDNSRRISDSTLKKRFTI